MLKEQLENLVVTVTLDHVREGVQKSCYNCPIALALRRPLEALGVYHYEVGSKAVHVHEPGVEQVYAALLPPAARDFIAAFDTPTTSVGVHLPTPPPPFVLKDWIRKLI